jgi:OOP family OmpA-OmpF porin
VYNGTKGLSGNLCWRTGYWAPSNAILECDPDLVPKPVPPAPPAAVPPPPTPAPPPSSPPTPGYQKITLASKALFDFDKAVLKPEGMAAIDRDVISRLREVQRLELVLVTGHTDPIGSQAYNQKLSERRADAVRNYLVSKGVPKDKIETLGMGKTQPVPGVVCNQKNFKERIACYAPDRRVEVEVKGEILIKK